MLIQLNGQPHEIGTGTTVADLAEKLGLDLRQCAIERNVQIVSKSAHAHTMLHDGDQIEIVEFIGGG